MIININTAASVAATDLTASTSMLKNSLARLSSNAQIAKSADDADGLDVSMKIGSTGIHHLIAIQANIANAISFLQTQDGALKKIGDILNRVSELYQLNQDATKSNMDKNSYEQEFAQLQDGIVNISKEKFNGISLFAHPLFMCGSPPDGSLKVGLSEDGERTMNIVIPSLQITEIGNVTTKAFSLNGEPYITMSLQYGIVKNAIRDLKNLRAQNAAAIGGLESVDILETKGMTENPNNQTFAVNAASESTSYARNDILVKSGAAILTQANTSSQTALKLLGGEEATKPKSLFKDLYSPKDK